MAHFNIIDLEPVKTYATRENAVKAVTKVLGPMNIPGRVCNVLILQDEATQRWYPVLCNIHPDYFHVVVHAGFNLIN